MFEDYCIQGEILYSCALGGHTERFGTCLAVVNEVAKVLGDCNRIFITSGNSRDSVLQDLNEAIRRVSLLGIPRIEKVEFFPNVSESLINDFITAGVNLHEYSYLALSKLLESNLSVGEIIVPPIEQYMTWCGKKCRS